MFYLQKGEKKHSVFLSHIIPVLEVYLLFLTKDFFCVSENSDVFTMFVYRMLNSEEFRVRDPALS